MVARTMGSRKGPCRLAAAAPARILAGLLLGIWGGPLLAQLTVDEIPQYRLINEEDTIKNDIARSRYHLGPLRIIPAVFITDAGYNNNVFGTATNQIADWTATISAGARFILPFGSKTFLRADAFPRYTWYDKLVDRRQFGGIYEGSLFGFYNHLSFQLTGTDVEDYRTYSSELDTRVVQRTHAGYGRVDLDLTHSISFITGGGAQWIKYQQISGPPAQEVQVQFNNRTDTAVWGGLRYKFTSDFDVAGLMNATWSAFDITPEFRDNRTVAVLGNVRLQRPNYYINAVGGYRKGYAVNSTYPGYSTPVGGLFVSVVPIHFLEVQVYGRRRTQYSVSELNPYYFEDRIGGSAIIAVGPRFRLIGYGEAGPNKYQRAQDIGGAVFVKRQDNATIYGGGLGYRLFQNAVLTGRYTHNLYTSNIPGAARTYNQFTAALSLEEELTR